MTRTVVISAALTAKAVRMTMKSRRTKRRARTMMRMILINERNSNFKGRSSKWWPSSRLGSKSISKMCNLRNWTRTDRKRMTATTISPQLNNKGEVERIMKVVRKVDRRARQVSNNNSKEDGSSRRTPTKTSPTARTMSHSHNNNKDRDSRSQTSNSKATFRICKHK